MIPPQQKIEQLSKALVGTFEAIMEHNARLEQKIAVLEANQKPEKTVSRAQAMKMLNCSNNTITNMIKDGRLTPKGRRFLLSEVEGLKNE